MNDFNVFWVVSVVYNFPSTFDSQIPFDFQSIFARQYEMAKTIWNGEDIKDQKGRIMKAYLAVIAGNSLFSKASIASAFMFLSNLIFFSFKEEKSTSETLGPSHPNVLVGLAPPFLVVLAAAALVCCGLTNGPTAPIVVPGWFPGFWLSWTSMAWTTEAIVVFSLLNMVVVMAPL